MIIPKKIFSISIKHGLACLIIISYSFCSLFVSAQESSNLSFNYDKISAHPRLLLKAGEEKLIKQAIKKSPELKVLHDYIFKKADGFLTAKPLIYKKDGKRLLAVSRNALTRFFYLSYAYRMTSDKKYLDRAEKELNNICSFTDWNPSHFLDVGEMSLGVSIAYDWLYKDLKPETRTLVEKAIVEKAFKPSYKKPDNFFLKSKSNWNSVSNAGLVFGALATLEANKGKAIEIIERSIKSNLITLKELSPDGVYPEGPTYWNYGTSFQVMLIAALESSLGSDNGLSKSTGFMQSAYYMLLSQGLSGESFNYYDCDIEAEASAAMFWFSDKLKDPSLLYNELKHITKGEYTSGRSDIERILPLAMIYSKKINLSGSIKPTKNVFTGGGPTPLYMIRTKWDGNSGRYFGIKGGRAYDSHGHMDAGSFVYETDGVRWAMDFGLQSYITLESKGVDLWNMEQNSQRWDVFRYNNLNHNTVSINNQRFNVHGKSEILETFKSAKEQGVTVDLLPVLNLNNDLKAATRKGVLVNNDYLKIEDTFTSKDKPVNVRWNMVTPSVAEIINDKTIKLKQKGKEVFLKFETDLPIKLVIRPSEKPSNYKCEFGDYNYDDYNQENKGTVMVGFDTIVPSNKSVKFTATIK